MEQHILDVCCLTGTGWPNEQGWNIVHDKHLLHVAVSNCVSSCYDNLVSNRSFWEVVDLIFVGLVHPVLPLVGLWKVAVVVDGSSVEASWQDFVLKLWNVIDLPINDLLVLQVHGLSGLGFD